MSSVIEVGTSRQSAPARTLRHVRASGDLWDRFSSSNLMPS